MLAHPCLATVHVNQKNPENPRGFITIRLFSIFATIETGRVSYIHRTSILYVSIQSVRHEAKTYRTPVRIQNFDKLLLVV
jgi:hypothetical protein